MCCNIVYVLGWCIVNFFLSMDDIHFCSYHQNFFPASLANESASNARSTLATFVFSTVLDCSLFYTSVWMFSQCPMCWAIYSSLALVTSSTKRIWCNVISFFLSGLVSSTKLMYKKLVKGWVISHRWVERSLHETVCRQIQINSLLESLCEENI